MVVYQTEGKEMITTAFKLMVRKMFSKVYGIPYVAAVSTIKKEYPAFNASKASHWEWLAEQLMDELEPPVEQLTQIATYYGSVHSKYGYTFTSHEYRLTNVKGYFLMTIGYSLTRGCYYIQSSHNNSTRPLYYTSYQAFQRAFHAHQLPLKAAA